MATPAEKLADSLAVLHGLQASGRRVFRSSELSRVHRERLQKQGFLASVIKGWLVSTSPSAAPGDSTPWYASFWEFCALYCAERFEEEWILSPEQSLLLNAEATAVPTQVVVHSPKGTNNAHDLPFGTGLYDLKKELPPAADRTERDGLRMYAPEAGLVQVSHAFFARHPVEAQVALAGIGDASDILVRLLAGGRSVVAGRLAGAFRRVGRADVADEILTTMRAAHYDVREEDPFEDQQRFAGIDHRTAPVVARISALWNEMREVVLEVFPLAPGIPKDSGRYLEFVDDIYQVDAYHSLSIEGYRVTMDLIDRVRSGRWNPDIHDADRRDRDALAARGYWQAFQEVKKTLRRVLSGENPGALARSAHREWYRQLFQPCVNAGLIDARVLAGYRNDAVYLRRSRHVPPRWQAVRDAIPALFDLLEQEKEASVRAVLGHWLFGYIHPYPDGNGRSARFLMNAMLASGGYPWTVIRVEDRDPYLQALESASVDQDIGPFASFLAERVQWSVEEAEQHRTGSGDTLS